MSSNAHTEHILPLKTYFGVFAALLVLTAITVWIAGFHFGPFNLIVAMAVAAIKASLVALYFMHLKYDNKVYLLIFLFSIAFLAVFIMFTMADTMTRGKVDEQRANPINPNAVIYRESPDTMTTGGVIPGESEISTESDSADTSGSNTADADTTSGKESTADTTNDDSAADDTSGQ